MKRTMLSLLTIIASCLAYADVSITDVTAQQRYPWNGKVDISYTVTGVEEKAKQEGLMTTLKVSAIDLTTSTTNVATMLSGDVSLADGTHEIVWDMNAQGMTFKSTNVVFNVACKTEQALYCIVDLSAGANATSYPVVYTNEIPGGSWSDEYKTSKLVLRRIESGTCIVTVDKPYYVGVFEVTQKQYELITGVTPSYFAGNDKRPVEQVSYNMIRGGNKGSQYPNSTDVDDDSFIGKLRTRTGRNFDLPTESQWEYACRANTTTTYSYGNSAHGGYMWYDCNSDSRTHDVGTRISNRWGLFDMHGNVCEWCLDWKADLVGMYRMVRGGTFMHEATFCGSSYQGMIGSPSAKFRTYGFRIVMSPLFQTGTMCAGDSDTVRADLAHYVRTAEPTEVLTCSPRWCVNAGVGAAAIIAVNGVTLSEKTESGTTEWTPSHDGIYELTHKVMMGGEQIGETLTATFMVDRFHPVISPVSGTVFDTSLTISMSCPAGGATIRYTKDGSTPTSSSPIYKKF